jgi:hypothetical protein
LRSALFIGLIACFAAHVAFAQSTTPTVEIVLSQPTAESGDEVTAEVYIRNAVNIGSADVGITVDDQCLRIVERTNGDFLPTNEEQGGSSPISEMNEHDTRLSVLVSDQSKLGNGDGVFFRVKMIATCQAAAAQLNVTFAELSGYDDPEADGALNSYTLDAGTVNIVNAELAIGAGEQITPTATSAPATATNAPAATSTVQPTTSPTATNAPAATNATNATSTPPDGAPTLDSTALAALTVDQRLLFAILCIVGLTVFGLIALFILSRRGTME